MSRSIENAARQRGARTTLGPDQGPVPSRSSARKGSAFPVHHLRSRRRRPQGAAWALGGQEARERAGRAWRIGAGASREEKQTPAAPIRLAAPGLDATPCLPKPRCNAGSLQGGVREDGQALCAGTHRRPSPGGDAMGDGPVSGYVSGRSPQERVGPKVALRFPSSCCRKRGAGGDEAGPSPFPLPLTVTRMSRDPRAGLGEPERAPASRAGSAAGRRAAAGPSLWTIALYRILPLDGGDHTVDE